MSLLVDESIPISVVKVKNEKQNIKVTEKNKQNINGDSLENYQKNT